MEDQSDITYDGDSTTPSAPNQTKRESRFTRMVDGIRSFLVEIAIVIVGVLIALLVNQGVDNHQWTQKIDAIRGLMQEELTTDDGPQAYGVLAQYFCRTRQLEALDAAVSKGNGEDIKRLSDEYAVPPITWDMEGWRMIVSGDVSSHISPREVTLWRIPYSWIEQLQYLEVKEREDVYSLRGIAAGLKVVRGGDRSVLLTDIRKLHDDNDIRTAYSALTVWGVVNVMHLKLDDESGQMDIMRRHYGKCVKDPDLSRMKWDNAPIDVRSILTWIR